MLAGPAAVCPKGAASPRELLFITFFASADPKALDFSRSLGSEEPAAARCPLPSTSLQSPPKPLSHLSWAQACLGHPTWLSTAAPGQHLSPTRSHALTSAVSREHLSTAALLTGTELCFPNMGAAQAADSLLRLHFPIAPSPQSPQGPFLCPPNHPTYPLPAASSPEMKVSPPPHAVCAIAAGDCSACSSPPKTLPIQKTKQNKTKKPHSFSDTSSLLPWRTLHGCVCVEPAVPVPSLPGQTGCCSPLQGKSFFFYLFTSGSL